MKAAIRNALEAAAQAPPRRRRRGTKFVTLERERLVAVLEALIEEIPGSLKLGEELLRRIAGGRAQFPDLRKRKR